jgi:hypothetical protein
MEKMGVVLRTVSQVLRFWPWGLVHIPALFLAILVLGRMLVTRIGTGATQTPLLLSQGLFAAFYLGWFLQSSYLQLRHDYVMAPAVLLALTVVAGFGQLLGPPLLRAAVVGVFALWVLPSHPLLQGERLSTWGRCFQEGSTPEIRDRLTLEKGKVHPVYVPNWEQLQAVAEFLRGQHLQDKELTVYSASATPLYLELGLRPSTPALHYDFVFPGDLERLRGYLNASPQRFVVADLASVMNVYDKELEATTVGTAKLPARFPKELTEYFPWSEPLVFRSGRYVVARVTGPVSDLGLVARERWTRRAAEWEKH